MKKVPAGVVTGLLLGAAQGALMAAGSGKGVEHFLPPILGRASQGIIAGILTAYATKPKTPLWRGGLTGLAVGAGLGFLAGSPAHSWATVIPYSAVVGLGCGLAVARAAR
jgi:hypothetical protein